MSAVPSEGVKTIRELLMDYFDLSEPMSVNDRAGLMRACIDLLADLNMVRSELSASLAADLETDQQTTPYGTLVRSSGSKRKNWDGRRLAYTVAAQTQFANDDDEPLEPDEIVTNVTEALVLCGGLDNSSHSWRAGELKKREINPNQFCEWQEGTPSVRFA